MTDYILKEIIRTGDVWRITSFDTWEDFVESFTTSKANHIIVFQDENTIETDTLIFKKVTKEEYTAFLEENK